GVSYIALKEFVALNLEHNNKEVLKLIRKVTIWLMIVCVMGLVFYFSNETVSSSMKVSIDISDKVLMLVNHFSAYLQMDGDYLFHLIRKFTHFIFYITLGGLVFKACIQNR